MLEVCDLLFFSWCHSFINHSCVLIMNDYEQRQNVTYYLHLYYTKQNPVLQMVSLNKSVQVPSTLTSSTCSSIPSPVRKPIPTPFHVLSYHPTFERTSTGLSSTLIMSYLFLKFVNFKHSNYDVNEWSKSLAALAIYQNNIFTN